MLNLRFDYGFIGRLFGVPRKFLSQVGAFCVSFASGHQIIDVRAPAFPDPEDNPVTVGINEDHLKSFVRDNETMGAAHTLDWSGMFSVDTDASGYNNILKFHAPVFDGNGRLTGFAATGVEIFTAAGTI